MYLSVHCHVHISLPLVSVLSQIIPLHAFKLISLKFILILSSYLRPYNKNGLLPLCFLPKILCALLIFSVPPTRQSNLHSLIVDIGEEQKYEAIYHKVLSRHIFLALPCPNFIRSTLLSQTFNVQEKLRYVLLSSYLILCKHEKGWILLYPSKLNLPFAVGGIILDSNDIQLIALWSTVILL